MMKEQVISKNSKLYILDLLTRITIVIVMVSFILYLVVIPESFAFFTYSTVSPAFIVEIKAPDEKKDAPKEGEILDNHGEETENNIDELPSEQQSEALEEGQSDANLDMENDIPIADEEIVVEEIVNEEVEDYEDTTIRQ
jgi:hypothetical protein